MSGYGSGKKRGGEDVCVKPETSIGDGGSSSIGDGGSNGIDGWGGNIENFGGHLEQWGSLPC